jgi:hypothetical protein
MELAKLPACRQTLWDNGGVDGRTRKRESTRNEDADFNNVVAALPGYLQDFARFAS